MQQRPADKPAVNPHTSSSWWGWDYVPFSSWFSSTPSPEKTPEPKKETVEQTEVTAESKQEVPSPSESKQEVPPPLSEPSLSLIDSKENKEGYSYFDIEKMTKKFERLSLSAKSPSKNTIHSVDCSPLSAIQEEESKKIHERVPTPKAGSFVSPANANPRNIFFNTNDGRLSYADIVKKGLTPEQLSESAARTQQAPVLTDAPVPTPSSSAPPLSVSCRRR